jgi:hypothetical protein
MSLETAIYFGDISDTFKTICTIACIGGPVLGLLLVIMADNDRVEIEGGLQKVIVSLFLCFFIFVIPAIFLPSQQTCDRMLIAKASREIINGSPVPEKLIKLLNKKLDEELKSD